MHCISWKTVQAIAITKHNSGEAFKWIQILTSYFKELAVYEQIEKKIKKSQFRYHNCYQEYLSVLDFLTSM